ncbi:hypothetical protein Mucpa_1003 [Mucilaginibacter paludis DSM 18603]|uniref:Uncharacterized protein n=1 Tax=Mucilaginibacter paludis DSM 18603 TaxID=714943 RepID=H1YDZ9_9SPHI|nr:hypothetical protein Mucpa_1003 [Mucilaginibacter paludis DSM 18603]
MNEKRDPKGNAITEREGAIENMQEAERRKGKIGTDRVMRLGVRATRCIQAAGSGSDIKPVNEG